MDGQSLEDFVKSVNGESHLRVEHDFGDGFVRLRTSEAERRQAAQDIRNSESIVLELLRNARDAHAGYVFVAISKEGDKRFITVIDNGEGIPAAMHEHVFEPRVTSKLDTNHMDAWGMHGRGMALYSIRVNAEESFVADSAPSLGCSVHVETDTNHLPEKKDQSSFPTFELTEDGSVNVRGPRNILRTACEFAIEARDNCAVYIGSPVEIAATLYEYGLSTLSAVERAFCHDAKELPLAKRLATASDPQAFSDMAAHMGLLISERSARRVLDGDVEPARALLDRITISGQVEATRSSMQPIRGTGRARSLKLGREDVDFMAASVKKAFQEIADRYYLEGDVNPAVRANRDRITVTIPVVKRL